eukprot:5752588-Alexandrium_andersonii.AAC.1
MGDRGDDVDIAAQLPVARIGVVPRPPDFAPTRPPPVRVPGGASLHPLPPDVGMEADAPEHQADSGAEERRQARDPGGPGGRETSRARGTADSAPAETEAAMAAAETAGN